MEYTSEPPRNIRYFFLGNEMSSPRQPGHKKAEDYALLAANIAKKFKEKDPLCQLILSGSSCRNAATYGYWDDTILEIAYDHIDFISLHAYFGPVKEDPDAFRCSDLLLDRHIEEVIAMCDAVAARKKTAKKLFLSLDEWNIWSGTNIPIVPQIKDFEDEYTALDAVVMGGLLMSILSHCHRLKIACLAQCCNILAPVMTREGGGAWKQTIYAPFALTSRYGRGKVLQNSFSCPEITLPQSGKKYPAQRLTCVYEEKEKRLSLFLLNRSIIEHGVFEVLLENFEPETIEETFLISPEDPMAVNRENEENLKVKKIEKYSLEGKKVSVELPAGAWGLVLVKLK